MTWKKWKWKWRWCCCCACGLISATPTDYRACFFWWPFLILYLGIVYRNGGSNSTSSWISATYRKSEGFWYKSRVGTLEWRTDLKGMPSILNKAPNRVQTSRTASSNSPHTLGLCQNRYQSSAPCLPNRAYRPGPTLVGVNMSAKTKKLALHGVRT